MSEGREPAFSEIRPWRTPGGLFALAAPGLIWLLSLAGLLDAFSGVAYDGLMRLSARFRREAARVVLVELEPQRAVGEPAYRRMLGLLDSLGAHRVAFTFLPADVSPAFYEEAVRRGVVFGWPVVPDPEDPDQRRLADLPAGVALPDGSFGLVAAPPGSGGVHRHAHAHLSIGTRRYPALEIAVAEASGAARLPAAVDSYLVYFSGGPGSLPAASLESLLQGALVSELVQGRTVLVGPALALGQPGLHTPTTSDSQAMSLLEFQGHALDTLLSGRMPRKLGGLATLLVLMVLTLPTLLVYQRLEVRLASWLTLGLLALHALVAVLLFSSLRVFPPVVELILAQGLLFVLALRGKALLASLAIDSLLQHLAARLRERLWPTSFYVSAEHWSQVINMVNQTLDLNRVIFLERVEADHRVREIKALNCSLEDIDEKRRDYERTPYSTAIEARRPIAVKGYLKRVERDEEQYLVPLAFAGEILGFWAFGVEPDKAAAIPLFDGVVRDFGDQISELLYHRQRVLKEESSGSPLLRLVRLQRELELYRALSRTMALVERRLGRVESLLDDLSTAAIMYDLFGRVLEANTRMLDLLRVEGLAPYNMTALDLVSALTGHAPAQCRRFLRKVIIDKAPVSLPVALAGGRSFALSLRALQARDLQGDPEEAAPFQLTGILCELVDTTSLSRLFDVKSHLMQRLGVQLRGDLAALEAAASRLATRELPEQEGREAASNVHERVVGALATIDECQQYLDRNGDSAERFPVDPSTPLERALEGLQPSARARGLTFERVQPKVMSPVFASPTLLQDVFGSVLGHLAEDALGGTSMRIQVREDTSWVTFSFANRGFGMPNDRFQAWLFSDENGGSDAARKLRTAIRWVRDWGGVVEAESEVGSGTRIELRFQRFTLAAATTPEG